MGIATRMASLMRLHREETYERITPSSTPEEIIRAESARRTMVCHTFPRMLLRSLTQRPLYHGRGIVLSRAPSRLSKIS